MQLRLSVRGTDGMPLGYFQLCPKLMFESEAKSKAIDVNFSFSFIFLYFFFHANKTHFTKMFRFDLKMRVFGTQTRSLSKAAKLFPQ